MFEFGPLSKTSHVIFFNRSSVDTNSAILNEYYVYLPTEMATLMQSQNISGANYMNK